MDVVALIDEAKRAGMELFQRQGDLVVRGPVSLEPLAKELIEHKQEVLASLNWNRDFGLWMEKQWMETSLPEWWNILDISIKGKDWKRTEFAWDMLVRGLRDDGAIF
jgi:hypothetical protein